MFLIKSIHALHNPRPVRPMQCLQQPNPGNPRESIMKVSHDLDSQNARSFHLARGARLAMAPGVMAGFGQGA
ncbi:hypothetical protein POHY109586_23905 [Polaromonas hydrogenivorans]